MNPFVYNYPVLNDDFFNREKTIENILRETVLGKGQGDVWLTGERKTGKTSFLKYLFFNNDKLVPTVLNIYGTKKKFRPLFCFANVQYCKTEKEFYIEMWQSIKNSLDFKIAKTKDVEKNFVNAIKYAFDKNIYPVFLVDEFDAFLEIIAIEDTKLVRHFVNKLNSYLTNFQNIGHKVFSCIFTSNQDFIDLNTKYNLQITGSGIIAETYDLHWFTQKHTIGLAKNYLANTDVHFTEKEIKFVYKYTDGYPYFTQKVFSFMYSYKKKQKVNKIDNVVLLDFIKDEYESTIKFWIGQDMPKRTFEKLKHLFDGLGEKIFDTSLKILVDYTTSKF